MIKNIIFDLGGVLVNLEPARMYAAFEELAGNKLIEENFSLRNQTPLFDDFDCGRVSVPEFRRQLSKSLGISCSDENFDRAWTSFVLDIPPDRIEFLHELSKKYQLFLLSNTNQIHLPHLHAYAQSHYGVLSLDSFFKKAYYSCVMGLRKPSAEAFHYVLADSHLVAHETVFIDDLEANADAARTVGIHALWTAGPSLRSDLERLLRDGSSK